MNTVLIATAGGLFTAVGWGTGDWLTAKSSRKFDKYSINFAVQIPSAILMSIVLLVGHFKFPTVHQLFILALYGVLITLAYLCFIKALSAGPTGVIVPLSSTYPLVTLLLSVIFLGTVFSGRQLAAMATIILGAVVLAYEKNHQKLPLKVLHKETFLTLAAVTLWGTAFFFINGVVKELPWQVISGFVSIIMATIATALLVMSNGSKSLISMKKSLSQPLTVSAGLIFTFGSWAFYIASAHAGSVVIPTVIASSGPLVTSVFSRVMDKEKIGFVKRMGAVIVVAGIVILNIA